MTKRELIDEILIINRSAKPAFLAEFGVEDLGEYLQHLHVASTPRPVVSNRTSAAKSAQHSCQPQAADAQPTPEGPQPCAERVDNSQAPAAASAATRQDAPSESPAEHTPSPAWPTGTESSDALQDTYELRNQPTLFSRTG